MGRRAITLIAILVLAAGLSACGSDGTPISEQNCHELSATLHKIQSDIDDANAGGTIEDKRKTMDDGEALNNRVDDLGGCPEEPALR